MSDTMDSRLFAAVSNVVDEHGWPGATAELIAQAAGVNRTTLYRNGHTREQMLVAATAEMAATFRAAALESLAHPGTALDRMHVLLTVLYDLADQHLGLVAGLYDGPTAVFHMGLDDTPGTALTHFEYTEPFARLLLDGNADRTLHSDDPTTDAELIFNTAGWTYVHFRRSHGWSARRTRVAVTRICLASFLGPTETHT